MNLNEKADYEFRIVAVNTAGKFINFVTVYCWIYPCLIRKGYAKSLALTVNDTAVARLGNIQVIHNTRQRFQERVLFFILFIITYSNYINGKMDTYKSITLKCGNNYFIIIPLICQWSANVFETQEKKLLLFPLHPRPLLTQRIYQIAVPLYYTGN